MRKVLYLGAIVAALIALVSVYSTHLAAQDGNRFGVQAPFLTLLSPGSSIGITVRDSDSGVVVQEVRGQSPASRAGVKEGDVVTEFDGERTRSAAQFTRLVRETAPGKTVKIAVLRSGMPTTMDIVPETRDSNDLRVPNLTRDFERKLQVLPRDFSFDFDLADPAFNRDSSRRLGVMVTPLSDQLAAYFGVKQGVLVSEVTAGSAGEAAGLKAGDVITTVKGQAISSSDDVVRELRTVESGTSVDIRVMRNHKELALTAKMPERTRMFAQRGARAI